MASDERVEVLGTPIQEREPKPRASFQFVMPPEEIEKLHGALFSAQQVELYNGAFLEPFSALAVMVGKRQNQLVMQAILEVDTGFTQTYGQTIGNTDGLKTVQKRYPETQLSDDGTTLIVSKKNQIHGVVQRVDDKHIVVLRGGNAGPVTLSDDQPVNDLKVEFNQFLLLTQRYITSLLQNSDASQMEMNLVLTLPQLTEASLAAFHSSFEIMTKEFRARHRELDLDSEIGGFPNAKTAVRGLYADITDPESSRKFGNQPYSNRFLLIAGNEGTGKSLFPKALDTMLSKKYGKAFEHFRLPLGDILRKYGPSSATVVKTILDHVRANERAAVVTAIHFDTLHALCAPDEQAGTAAMLKHMEIIEPVVTVFRDFGNDLGPSSKYVAVIGESRVSPQYLPEAVQKVFRRSITLRPTKQDLAEALMVQVRKTRKFAEGSGIDPIDSEVDKDPTAVITDPEALTGKDIQQAILNITQRNKTSGKSPEDVKITPAEISMELAAIQIEKGLSAGRKAKSTGFNLRATR